MLIERTFAIGGWLCVAAAAMFAVVIVSTGALVLAPVLLMTPVLFGVIGALFLIASGQARTDRRALLSTGTPQDRSAPRSGPR